MEISGNEIHIVYYLLFLQYLHYLSKKKILFVPYECFGMLCFLFFPLTLFIIYLEVLKGILRFVYIRNENLQCF